MVIVFSFNGSQINVNIHQLTGDVWICTSAGKHEWDPSYEVSLCIRETDKYTNNKKQGDKHPHT